MADNPLHDEDDTTLSTEGDRVKVQYSKLSSTEKKVYSDPIGQSIWPTCKLLGDPRDESTFIDKVCDLLNPHGFASDAARVVWKNKHGNACISCLNATRCNIVSLFKEKAKNWWELHQRTMPNLAKLQQIASRTIELVLPNAGGENANEDGEDANEDHVDIIDNDAMNLAVWWWDEILPSATASNTKFWTPRRRWYNHIYDGQVGGEPLLTPQDEAFALLCMENYSKQWENDFKLQLEHPGKNIQRADKKKFVMPTDPTVLARGYVVTEKAIVKFGDRWANKYTLSNAGSKLSGGWTTAGKQKYLKCLKHVQRGRKLATTPAKEALILAKVKEVNGVVGDNYDEYLQARKRARRGPSILDGLSLFEAIENQVEPGEDDDISAFSAEVEEV